MRRSVGPEPPFEWDWIYLVLIVLVVVVLLAVTFELWAPHGDLHRDGAVRTRTDQGVVAIGAHVLKPEMSKCGSCRDRQSWR